MSKVVAPLARLADGVIRAWFSYGIWLVAIGAALAAAWAAHAHIQGREQDIERRSQRPHVQRVVAGRDLPAGQVLAVDDLAERAIPEAWAPSLSVAPEDVHTLLDMRLKVPVEAGAAISSSDVESWSPSVSRLLSPGRRALIVPLRELADAPRLQAGDHVDLYVTLQYQQRAMTVPLLRNGRVIEANAGEQLVLETSADDVTRFIAARQSGVLTLALRADGDGPGTAMSAHDIDSILGLERAAPLQIPVLYGDSHNDPEMELEP